MKRIVLFAVLVASIVAPIRAQEPVYVHAVEDVAGPFGDLELFRIDTWSSFATTEIAGNGHPASDNWRFTWDDVNEKLHALSHFHYLSNVGYLSYNIWDANDVQVDDVNDIFDPNITLDTNVVPFTGLYFNYFVRQFGTFQIGGVRIESDSGCNGSSRVWGFNVNDPNFPDSLNVRDLNDDELCFDAQKINGVFYLFFRNGGVLYYNSTIGVNRSALQTGVELCTDQVDAVTWIDGQLVASWEEADGTYLKAWEVDPNDPDPACWTETEDLSSELNGFNAIHLEARRSKDILWVVTNDQNRILQYDDTFTETGDAKFLCDFGRPYANSVQANGRPDVDEDGRLYLPFVGDTFFPACNNFQSITHNQGIAVIDTDMTICIVVDLEEEGDWFAPRWIKGQWKSPESEGDI